MRALTIQQSRAWKHSKLGERLDGSMENPYNRGREVINEIFFQIWQHHNAMNSSALPCYYHVFYIFIKRNWFLVRYTLTNHFTKGSE